MKLNLTITCLIALAGFTAQGATTLSYVASASPGSNPDANSGTANAWIMGGAGGGDFLGDSGTNGDNNGAGAGASAWAIHSSSSLTREAVHTFDGGTLGIAQGVKLDFDNGYLNSGAVVGVSLWNASNQNLFEFYFTGGNSFYQKNDNGGVTNTTKGFTDDGFQFTFVLDSATTYTAALGSTPLSGTLITQGDQAIAKIRVFSYNNPGAPSDNDLFFNNLVITPEPSRMLLLGLGLAGLFMRRRR